MTVLEFPPRAFFRIIVREESRNGTEINLMFNKVFLDKEWLCGSESI